MNLTDQQAEAIAEKMTAEINGKDQFTPHLVRSIEHGDYNESHPVHQRIRHEIAKARQRPHRNGDGR